VVWSSSVPSASAQPGLLGRVMEEGEELSRPFAVEESGVHPQGQGQVCHLSGWRWTGTVAGDAQTPERGLTMIPGSGSICLAWM
jgi:hypothetical protein